jgi:hypothetical protein
MRYIGQEKQRDDWREYEPMTHLHTHNSLQIEALNILFWNHQHNKARKMLNNASEALVKNLTRI